MYLVWFQWYEEAYFAVGGFRKVAPEELQDDEALVSYFFICLSICHILSSLLHVSAEKFSFSQKGQLWAP